MTKLSEKTIGMIAMYNSDQWKVGRDEQDGLTVSTCYSPHYTPAGLTPHDWETFVVDGDDWDDPLQVERYQTRDEAVEGHAAMVKKWFTQDQDK